MNMKLLLYCTKAKPYLTRNDLPNEKGEFYKHWQLGGELDKKHLYGDTPILNGKIVAECDFEVEEIKPEKYWHSTEDFDYIYNTGTVYYDDLLKKSCLMDYELDDYLGCEDKGYAIHIKNLHIFDKPINIRNYYNIAPKTMQDCMNQRVLVKAPQNMMYANGIGVDKQGRYILISIKPQWLCKILNGEKTIEVRKKVLKEMLI